MSGRLLATQFGCSSDPNNAPMRPVSHALIMAWPTDQSSRSIPSYFRAISAMQLDDQRPRTNAYRGPAPGRAAYPPLHSANQRLLKEGRERFYYSTSRCGLRLQWRERSKRPWEIGDILDVPEAWEASGCSMNITRIVLMIFHHRDSYHDSDVQHHRSSAHPSEP
jgi:hypothetical protein